MPRCSHGPALLQVARCVLCALRLHGSSQGLSRPGPGGRQRAELMSRLLRCGPCSAGIVPATLMFRRDWAATLSVAAVPVPCLLQYSRKMCWKEETRAIVFPEFAGVTHRVWCDGPAQKPRSASRHCAVCFVDPCLHLLLYEYELPILLIMTAHRVRYAGAGDKKQTLVGAFPQLLVILWRHGGHRGGNLVLFETVRGQRRRVIQATLD